MKRHDSSRGAMLGPKTWGRILADDRLCLSCGAPAGGQPFCATCVHRSKQAELSSKLDDLGVGD